MTLPVDPKRLHSVFPALTDEDLEAYASVTKRILADPKERGKRTREVLDLARAAEAAEARGEPLGPREREALRYSRALAKMQPKGR